MSPEPPSGAASGSGTFPKEGGPPGAGAAEKSSLLPKMLPDPRGDFSPSPPSRPALPHERTRWKPVGRRPGTCHPRPRSWAGDDRERMGAGPAQPLPVPARQGLRLTTLRPPPGCTQGSGGSPGARPGAGRAQWPWAPRSPKSPARPDCSRGPSQPDRECGGSACSHVLSPAARLCLQVSVKCACAGVHGGVSVSVCQRVQYVNVQVCEDVLCVSVSV